MVFDYKIIPVQNDTLDPSHKVKGFTQKRKTVTRRFKKDRRRAKADRRKSVRDGVIVNLSFKDNRRKGRDRRRNQSDVSTPRPNISRGVVV